MLTTSTDFQGNSTFTTYHDLNDPTGGYGHLASVTDAMGHKTAYDTEPFVGRVTKTTLPDGRSRQAEWAGLDPSINTITVENLSGPYFLKSSTDERGRRTAYSRYGNTGFVYQVDYPDGGHKYFQYQGFGVNGYAFYKVQCITDQRGAQTIFGFDETDVPHGGSGFAGLMTSVTRSYNDGYGSIKQEKTRLYYDNLDQLIKSVDPRGVTELYAYTPRGQLKSVTHAADGTHVDYGYDDFGNCISVSDELGHTSTTGYDEYRRVLFTTEPVNDGRNPYRFRQYVYDHRDNANNSTATARSHTSATWGVSWTWNLKAVQRVYTANQWLGDE